VFGGLPQETIVFFLIVYVIVYVIVYNYVIAYVIIFDFWPTTLETG
jgi:type IV secretory pathway VirB3-like protein